MVTNSELGCEKRQEEYATLQSKQSLEKRIQQFANQRQELESEISQKEQEFSRLLGAKKELEQQAIVIKNALEEHVIEEANMAFADYLNNQAENFVAIAECYGEEAVEKLKQEQFNEFVEITRKNQRVLILLRLPIEVNLIIRRRSKASNRCRMNSTASTTRSNPI